MNARGKQIFFLTVFNGIQRNVNRELHIRTVIIEAIIEVFIARMALLAFTIETQNAHGARCFTSKISDLYGIPITCTFFQLLTLRNGPGGP